MSRLFPLVVLVLFSAGNVRANPVAVLPCEEIGITEVFLDQNSLWSIELNGRWLFYGQYSLDYPCTTDVYLVTASPLRNTRATIKIEVEFDENRCGVIYVSSMIGLQPGRANPFMPPDTIMVTPDTTPKSYDWSLQDTVPYWKFPLQPVKTGNSLIMVEQESGMEWEQKKIIKETSRTTIGSFEKLFTRYTLKIVDSYGNSLENIGGASRLFTSYPDAGVQLKTSGPDGIVKFSISIVDSSKPVYFYDLLSGHFLGGYNFLPYYTAKYVDEDSVLTDTLQVPLTCYELTLIDNKGAPALDMDCFHGRDNQYGNAVNISPYGGNIWNLRIFPVDSTATFCFNPDGITPVDGCTNSWMGTFVETGDTLRDTLVVATTTAGTFPATEQYSGIRLSTAATGNGTIRFIITSPAAYTKARLLLLSAAGRKMGEMVQELSGRGTHTVLWKPETNNLRQLQPGTYVCRLSIDGYAPVSHRFTVR